MLVSVHDGTRAAWAPMLDSEPDMLPMSREAFEAALGAAALGSVFITESESDALYVRRAGGVFCAARDRVSTEGERGPRGNTGPRGLTGDRGAAGPRGPESQEQGEQGEDGERGMRGVSGPRGEQGDRGHTGRAVNGDQGGTGEEGPRGATGDTGDVGAGVTGPRGETGRSGQDSTEEGIRGRTGPTGREGKQGKRGPTGPDGYEGERGARGEAGPTGHNGDTGGRGETGPRGATGPDAPVAPLRPVGASDVRAVPSEAWPVVDTQRSSGSYGGVTFSASKAAVMNPFAEPNGTLSSTRYETAHWRASKDEWLEIDFGKYACVVSYAIGTDRGTSVGLTSWRVVVGEAHEITYAPAAPLVTNGAMYELFVSAPAARTIRLVYTGTGAPCVRFVPRVVGPDARETRLAYSARPGISAGVEADVYVAVSGTCAETGAKVRVFATRDSLPAETVCASAAMDASGYATAKCTFSSAGTYLLSAAVTSADNTYTWPTTEASEAPLVVVDA